MGSILKIFPFVKELTVSNNKITGTGIWKLCLDSQENSEVQVLDVSKSIHIQAKIFSAMKRWNSSTNLFDWPT